mgnify:CR=1 FL=1
MTTPTITTTTLEVEILAFAVEQWGEKTPEKIGLKLAEETGEVCGALVKIPEKRSNLAKLQQEYAERDQAAGLLCSALEGGSNYWYMIDGAGDADLPLHQDPAFEKSWGRYVHAVPFREGGRLEFSVKPEGGDGGTVNGKTHWTLDRAAIERGLSLLAEKSPHHFAAILAEDSDAATGDCFLQYALFGELVFG